MQKRAAVKDGNNRSDRRGRKKSTFRFTGGGWTNTPKRIMEGGSGKLNTFVLANGKRF